MKGKPIEIEANGLRFAALELGQGPLLLCLHGFPDTAEGFRHQMEPLAEAGFRVVAPYMRGYAPTAVPADGVFQSAVLGRDAVALIDALGAERAAVFGHDWGSIAASFAALTAPERIERLVTAAVPYGPGLAVAMMSSYEQQKRFWYQYLFQLPIAEVIVSMNDLAFIRRLWEDWSPGWKFTDADIAPVLECLGRPGVLPAALSYYRALYDPALQSAELGAEQSLWGAAPITVPTLHIHGADDGCIGAELCEGMEAVHTAGLERLIVEGAGHFVHAEKPAEVNRTVIDFLAA